MVIRSIFLVGFLFFNIAVDAEKLEYAEKFLINNTEYLYFSSDQSRKIFSLAWQNNKPKLSLIKEFGSIESLWTQTESSFTTDPLVASLENNLELVNPFRSFASEAKFDFGLKLLWYGIEGEKKSPFSSLVVKDLDNKFHFLQRTNIGWKEWSPFRGVSAFKKFDKGIVAVSNNNGAWDMWKWNKGKNKYRKIKMPTQAQISRIYELSTGLIAFEIATNSSKKFNFCGIVESKCIGNILSSNIYIEDLDFSYKSYLILKNPSKEKYQLFLYNGSKWESFNKVIPSIKRAKKIDVDKLNENLLRISVKLRTDNGDWSKYKYNTHYVEKDANITWKILSNNLPGNPTFYRAKSSQNNEIIAAQIIREISSQRREPNWIFYNRTHSGWSGGLPEKFATNLRKVWSVKFQGNNAIGLQDFGDSDNDEESYEWNWYLNTNDNWTQLDKIITADTTLVRKIYYGKNKDELLLTDKYNKKSYYITSDSSNWVKVF